MKLKNPLKGCTSWEDCPPKLREEELSYRFALRVTEEVMFKCPEGKTGYFVCPKCKELLPREYMGFCDYCGQRLDWKGADKPIRYDAGTRVR